MLPPYMSLAWTYLPTHSKAPAPPPTSLKYGKCAASELRTFIKDRAHEDVPKQKKHLHVRRLYELDANLPPFRFMDLPPEMRTMVYTELLTHNAPEGSVAYSEILRTCKDIYNEASTVLNADSSVELCAGFCRKIAAHRRLSIIHHHIVTESTGSVRCLLRGREQFIFMTQSAPLDDLQRLHRVQNIDLTVRLALEGTRYCQWNSPGTAWDAMVEFFERLLFYCADLRLVKINFQDLRTDRATPQGRAQLVASLQTLRALSEKCTLDLRGLETATFDAFWRSMRE